MENIALLSDKEKSAKNVTTLIYALYAASFLVVFAAIAGIILNYLKREEVAGTFMESHFDWQIRTFWIGLLGGGIGALTTWLYIGWAILLAVAVWVIYRIVKGWLSLNQNQAMALE
jgi:uncharacterized membrane protein